MNYNYFGNTDVGKKRENNEDYYGFLRTKNGDVFIVCDGMGGHAGGEIASELATKSVINYLNAKYIENPINAIVKAIQYANNVIYNKAQEEPYLKGMGTTITVALIRDELIYIAHVGDSRIYLLSDNNLHRLTVDHSFVQELVNKGIITEEQAENHPRKNQLLKALGIKPGVEVTVSKEPFKLKKNDILLLCSDGLTGMVNDLTLKEILLKKKNIKDKANELISIANNAGGVDNITLILIEITSSKHKKSSFMSYGTTQTIKVKKRKSKILYYSSRLAIAAMIIFGIFVYLKYFYNTPKKPPTDTPSHSDTLPQPPGDTNKPYFEVNGGNDSSTPGTNTKKLEKSKKQRPNNKTDEQKEKNKSSSSKNNTGNSKPKDDNNKSNGKGKTGSRKTHTQNNNDNKGKVNTGGEKKNTTSNNLSGTKQPTDKEPTNNNKTQKPVEKKTPTTQNQLGNKQSLPSSDTGKDIDTVTSEPVKVINDSANTNENQKDTTTNLNLNNDSVIQIILPNTDKITKDDFKELEKEYQICWEIIRKAALNQNAIKSTNIFEGYKIKNSHIQIPAQYKKSDNKDCDEQYEEYNKLNGNTENKILKLFKSPFKNKQK